MILTQKWLSPTLRHLLYYVCVVLLSRDSFLGCVIFLILFVCSAAQLFLLGCQYQCKRLTGKTRLRQCVDGDVKLYSLTHSVTINIGRPMLSMFIISAACDTAGYPHNKQSAQGIQFVIMYILCLKNSLSRAPKSGNLIIVKLH